MKKSKKTLKAYSHNLQACVSNGYRIKKGIKIQVLFGV